MKTWYRKLGMGTVVLALAGVLGGCDDSGPGGSSLIRLFFGINGSGNCDSVVIDVDLDAANAVIARTSDGELQCAINSVLAAGGCDIDFSTDGDTLHVEITGCTIPAITNLFDCFFETVDLSEINIVTTAECDCTAVSCDPDPPVCVSQNPDPQSCENCTNGVDDDDNGLTDCQDPNCRNHPACTDTTTTSTSTTSSSTTTTTSSTTTTSTTTSTSTSTTLEVPTFECRIVFRLDDAVEVGSLQWDTDYGDAPGFFTGSAGNVECASLVQDSIASFNDKDAQQVLSAGIISLDGFNGPTNLAECTFSATVVPVPADFDIDVVDAADPNIEPIEPEPDVIISLIDCEITTTTTNTTTTTDTTTTTGGPVTTTTLAGPDVFSVTISLASASAEVGALQFDVGYSNAPGEFNDSAAAVDCVNQVANTVFAPNDNEATNTLSLGYVSLDGFSAPTNLVICDFTSNGTDPVPANFTITVQDASDPDFNAITVDIDVAVAPKP